MTDIATNLDRLRAKIPAHVTLIAVSKTVEPERVGEAIAAGQLLFGESKVQEAKAKIPLVSGRARWHMIGHLQSNKVRDAVQLFEMIHSVDNIKLAVEIDKWADRLGKTMPVLLEVNVAGESSKYGLKPEDVPGTLAQLRSLRRIEVRGLMTVPPFTKEVEQARPYFRKLRELRDAHGLPELSMGMSHDFEVAIAEGATMVRVGTGIFGERKRHEPAE